MTTNFHHYVGPPKLHAADYPEQQLRCRETSDVRSYAEVLTENYGPEGSGWEFEITDLARQVGNVLLHADGAAHYYEKYGQKSA
jgi:hypothetical protein